MHLYGTPASPFVQRALMAARAKGCDLAVRMPPGGGLASDEFRAISPMGRIPLLALDSGDCICESAAIAGYLDDVLDGPALLPADPLARARVREIEALVISEVAAGARPLMVQLVFGRGDSTDIATAARAQVAQGLDALERLVGTADAALTLADCALVPVLTLTRIVNPMTGLWDQIAERSAVAAYYEAKRAHPVAARTIDEMQTGFAAMLARPANPA